MRGGGQESERERDGGELALTDLRIGAESGYIFSFTVAERDGDRVSGGGDRDGEGNGEGGGNGSEPETEGESRPSGPWRSVVARDLPPEIDPAALGWLVRRTVDESVELPGAADGPS